MPNAALKPEERFTYADYLSWPEDERWELIDGEAWDMTPAPGTRHQGVSMNLASHIFQSLREGGKPCTVFAAPFDVRLPERADQADAEIETVVQPDLVVVCDRSKLDEEGCRGAPDWVIEVLSPRSAARDHIRKLALYQRHGVAEYWIVDPANRVVFVRRLGESGEYAAPEVFASDAKVAVAALPGLEIDLAEVFAE